MLLGAERQVCGILPEQISLQGIVAVADGDSARLQGSCLAVLEPYAEQAIQGADV